MSIWKTNKCVWPVPLQPEELHTGKVHFDLLDISDLLGGFPQAVRLHEAWISGAACAGSIKKKSFGQSQCPHPFTLE